MSSSQQLLIFGASARAAAFSALRAGLQPWCADLFADADLSNRCAVTQISADQYPKHFLNLAGHEIDGPLMYTGALENHPRLIRQMARLRPLWGNRDKVLDLCRHPGYWGRLLDENNIPRPTAWPWDRGRPLPIRWLVKPLRGAGGRGINFWIGAPQLPKSFYLQEFVQGTSCAAIYCGSSSGSALLGVTQQLVGEGWLHVGRFQYCGSIGPFPLVASLRESFEHLGKILVSGLKLRGLFGVDCVLRDGVPYPVEINPRYTASVEVLEYAMGLAALNWHRWAFEGGDQPVSPAPSASEGGNIVGKAILFARAPLTFPPAGPWMDPLRQPGDIWDMPTFADIPHPGSPIEAGKPILTFFARADSPEGCRAKLQQRAAELDDLLL